MFIHRTRLVGAALLLCTPVFAQTPSATPSPAAAAASASAPGSSPAQGAAAAGLADEKDKISYSIGVDIGRTLQRLQLDLNQDALTRGMTDILGNKPTALTDAELQQTLQAFQQQLMQKQQAALAKKTEQSKATAEKNKAEGKKFLDANSKKPGVKTLPSGLQYEVVKEGTGEKPKDNDTVSTNYKGTLLNGTEFDSSQKNGGPVSFPVNGVIKGWSEALKMMPVGSSWKIYVPSDLGYGDEGAGDQIEPGSTLVFDVELIGIKKSTDVPVTPPAADAEAAGKKKGS